MSDIQQLTNVAIVLIIAIGTVDSFRIYFRVFKRFGGSENFLVSHVSASVIAFLRFIPYFLVAACVLWVGNTF